MAVRCDSCNLIYMNHRLAEVEISRYYSSYTDKRNTVSPDLLEKRGRMYEIDRSFVEIFVNNGSVLDIGCGSGDFISTFPLSITKYGFDIDKPALNVGGVLHPSVKFYNALSEVSEGQTFDCIIFRGTLQYQRDLKQIVKFCQLYLKERGYLILLATPNADSPAACMQRESWVLFNRIEHLYHFTVDTVSTLFQGFERIHFDYPYIGTPYENQSTDLDNFIALCRGTENQTRFPFWGSMMNVVFRKPSRQI